MRWLNVRDGCQSSGTWDISEHSIEHEEEEEQFAI